MTYFIRNTCRELNFRILVKTSYQFLNQKQQETAAKIPNLPVFQRSKIGFWIFQIPISGKNPEKSDEKF